MTKRPYRVACKKCGETKLRSIQHTYVCAFCKDSTNSPHRWEGIRNMILAIKPRCIICNRSSGETTISLHHKDKNRGNNELSNLQILCRQCHTSLHKNMNKTLEKIIYGNYGVRLVFS